jgi:amphi-Trp domain-containing protein
MTVPVASSVPVRFRGWARRDAAAFYLTELAKGILSGELSVRSRQTEVAVATAEFMTLDIEVRQRKRGTRVDVKIKWPKRSSPLGAG